MGIYLFILFLSVILVFINKLNIIKTKYIKIGLKTVKLNINLLEIVFIILLIFFSAFRANSVGTDLNNYIYMMDRLKHLSIGYYMNFYNLEFGFALIQKILVYFFPENYICIFKLLSSISIILFSYFFIKKFSKESAFSLFLLITFSFYNQSFNIIRQYIAIAVVFNSFVYLKEEKKYKFFLSIILAFFIHKTAIFGGLIYFIYKVYVKNKRDITKLCMGVILLGVSFFITSNVALPIFAKIFSYSKYLNRNVGGELGVGLLINLLLWLLFTVFKDKFKKNDSNFALWWFLSSFTLALNIMTVKFTLLSRVLIYGRFAYIVSIPNFIDSFEGKGLKRMVSIICMLLFIVYYLYIIKNGTCYDTIPYMISK